MTSASPKTKHNGYAAGHKPPQRDACGPSRSCIDDLPLVLEAAEPGLDRFNMALINLKVGLGLPTMETEDVFDCLPLLERWAELVDMNTRHWWPQFESRPAEYERSPARFRMLCLVTILQKHLGVRYNLAFSEGDYDGRDPRNHFLHGVLSGHGGTCVTMPVLYVAVGRRLGYPLFLVRAKEHVFVRWEGDGDRFNIEATSPGFEARDDGYYLHRPRPLTAAELDSGCYLCNLSRREEIGLFLYERGCCLRDLLRLAESVHAFSLADRFAPGDPCILGQWAVTEILWHSFEQQKRHSVSQGRDHFQVTDVAIPHLQRERFGERELEWAAAHLARLKRMHPRTKVNWVSGTSPCSITL